MLKETDVTGGGRPGAAGGGLLSRAEMERVLSLTGREYAALEAIGRGMQMKEMGGIWGEERSVGTVWATLRRVRVKLGLNGMDLRLWASRLLCSLEAAGLKVAVAGGAGGEGRGRARRVFRARVGSVAAAGGGESEAGEGIRGGGASDGARGRARSPSDGARGRARSPSDGARGGQDPHRMAPGGGLDWEGVREMVERDFGGVLWLSAREMEMFRLLGMGVSTEEGSRRMGISVKTWETFMAQARVKTGSGNAFALRAMAGRYRVFEELFGLRREEAAPAARFRHRAEAGWGMGKLVRASAAGGAEGDGVDPQMTQMDADLRKP